MLIKLGWIHAPRKKTMNNVGKIFEEDFKKSVPENVLLHRLADPAQAFGGVTTLRFSLKNPFDFILFDCDNRMLYGLELKTVKGKSISFERNKEEKGEIHHWQIEGLRKWASYKNVISGFLINFRGLDKTIFIHINDFLILISKTEKKSFSYSDLEKYDINFVLVGQKKARTRNRYDIGKFLETMKH